MSLSLPVFAEGNLAIPNIEGINPVYSSIALLLNPCDDSSQDKDTTKLAAEARKQYPPKTCDSPALVSKLFKARFLQYSMIPRAKEPWHIEDDIAKQDEIIEQCKDVDCLDKALDNVVNQLAPLYLASAEEDMNTNKTNSLCIRAIDRSTMQKYEATRQQLVNYLSESNDRCAGYGYDDEDENGNAVHYPEVNANMCHSKRGDLLVAECQINMRSNQVNTPTWVYQLKQEAKPKVLFESSNGSFAELSTVCNGMPDLFTSTRYSMGEHLMEFYRYDGDQYQLLYQYMEQYIGDDINGNNMSVAAQIIKNQHKINCHKGQ